MLNIETEESISHYTPIVCEFETNEEGKICIGGYCRCVNKSTCDCLTKLRLQITEAAIFTFRDMFTSHDINKLIWKTSFGNTRVYGYEDCSTLFVSYDGDHWEIINYNVLTTDGLLNVSGLQSDVSLYENSDARIKYELYYDPPFDAILKLNNVSVKSIVKISKDRYELGNNLWLDIMEDGVSYMICKDDHLLSGFRDFNADYQLGDAETIVYIGNDNSVVVENHGDVSSLIIIRGLFSE